MILRSVPAGSLDPDMELSAYAAAAKVRIVIGKGGARIKEIGTAARKALQEFLGRRVHLDLVVKVRGDWREDERVLHDVGVDGSGRDE